MLQNSNIFFSANHPDEYKIYSDEYTAKLKQRQEMLESFEDKTDSGKKRSKKPRRALHSSDSSDNEDHMKWRSNDPEQRKFDSVIGYWLAAIGIPYSIMDLPDTQLLFNKLQPKLQLRLGREYYSRHIDDVYDNMKTEIKNIIQRSDTETQANMTVELLTSGMGRNLLMLKMQVATSDFLYHNLTLDVVELPKAPTTADLALAFNNIINDYKASMHPNCKISVTYRTNTELSDALYPNEMVRRTWYDGVSRLEKSFNHGIKRSPDTDNICRLLSNFNLLVNKNEGIRKHFEEICSLQSGNYHNCY
jgi:hypothetical protein